MRAERLLETAIYGQDLDALEQFYVELLGLESVARAPGRNLVLRCAAAALILFDPAASGAPDGPFLPLSHRRPLPFSPMARRHGASHFPACPNPS